MQSVEERRHALMNQIDQLKRELDDLERQDCGRSQLRDSADRGGSDCLSEYDSRSDGKGR